MSLILSLQLGITLWKGMLKKQPYSACFFYILYIDVIHNLMHNTHMAVSYYTHNGLVYISHTPNTYSEHMIKTSGTMPADKTSGII